MALSIPQILRQFKTDVSSAVSAQVICEICGYLPFTWRERVLDPVTTVHVFLLQILHGNTACTALSRLAGVPFTAGQPLAPEFLKPIQSFNTSDVLGDFTIAADNSSIYSAGQDKAMHVWKLASPVPTRNFGYGANVDAVAFHPNGAMLAAAGHDGKLRLLVPIAKMQIAVYAAIHALLAALVRLRTDASRDPHLELMFVALGEIASTCNVLWDTMNLIADAGEGFSQPPLY